MRGPGGGERVHIMADLNAPEEEVLEKTLSQLAKLNEPKQMQRLIDDGADPSAGNRIGQTALHVACIWGNYKCVEVLIKAGAQVLRARHHTI